MPLNYVLDYNGIPLKSRVYGYNFWHLNIFFFKLDYFYEFFSEYIFFIRRFFIKSSGYTHTIKYEYTQKNTIIMGLPKCNSIKLKLRIDKDRLLVNKLIEMLDVDRS